MTFVLIQAHRGDWNDAVERVKQSPAVKADSRSSDTWLDIL